VAQPKSVRNRNIDLAQLDKKEWESLCSHCGICCLNKILDVKTGDIYTTSVVCEYYDLNSGRCSVYDKRFEFNTGCTKITPDNIPELSWLPNCCSYRRIYEKRPPPKNPSAAGKVPPPWDNRLEQILGCKVVVYQEDMDLGDYIILCQCGE
jgi:uncharacterized cysteine cluster protein YcgN (CxxCxxCC family)